MCGRTAASLAGRITRLALVSALAIAAAEAARAADASPWDKGMSSAVRLIAGSTVDGGSERTFRAGIEIRLDEGWKTYWRYPGDSGVPPRFDFTRSDNVRSILVKWPAPHRFSDDGGQSIGYKGHVVLPLSIVPHDAKRPVRLHLDLDYAICARLCVPAQAKAELTITGGRTQHEQALLLAEARVPKPSAIGESSALAISAARREASHVVVDVRVAGEQKVDLFAEGPTPHWALPLPDAVAGAAAGLKRFSFALDGLPPGTAADGAALTLTAVAGDAAIEVTYRVPGASNQ
jgi:DsbC/DsbD-like thiol-disulfide interchange protein